MKHTRAEAALYWTAVFAVALVVAFTPACAPIPQRPPEVRLNTVEVPVPIAVPCFTEAERPVLAPATPIDIDNATVDQMVAAITADQINETLYRNAVDALFLKCLKPGGTK